MVRSFLLQSLALFTLLVGCATAPKEQTVFYPPLPEQPRLQFLTSITGEDDVGKKAGAFRQFVVGREDSPKKVLRPHDIGSVKGKLYISDRSLHTILIIDLEKGEFDFFKDERQGALKEPFGIHVTADGNKYVVDGERKQVVMFGPDDKFIRAYGEKDQFDKPLDVAVFGDRLYIADFKRHGVVVVDKETGKTLQTIGKRGTGPGEFDRPTHLRVDRKGNLFVNDSFNFRIQKLAADGTFLKEYGYSGSTVGGFARPKGLDLSPEGDLLFVVDAAFENVQVFSEDTTDLLLYFGTFGSAPGSLYLPSALFVDDKNMEYFQRYVDKDFKIRFLIIAGSHLGAKKLNIYGFGDWIGEKLPEIDPRKPEKSDAAK